MDKKTLAKSMEEYAGSPFMNQSQLAKYLRLSRHRMPELLTGVDYLETKRERRYFVPDIAQKLVDMKMLG